MVDSNPTVVTIPNADDVVITSIDIRVVGKLYPLPALKPYDTCSLFIQSSPLNAGNIFVTKTTGTRYNSIILTPGQVITFRVKNANIFSVLGTSIGDNVIVSCEIGKGR